MSAGEFGRDLKYLHGLSASMKEEIRVRQEELLKVQNEIVAQSYLPWDITRSYQYCDEIWRRKLYPHQW